MSSRMAGSKMDYSVLDIRVVSARPDALLASGQLVGSVLDRQIRSNDVLLRFHNGRFLVILVDVGPEAARRITDRLELAVEALVTTGLADGAIEVSLEVENHVHPQDSAEPSVAAVVADAAAKLGVGDRS